MLKKYKVIEVEWMDAQSGFSIPEEVGDLIKDMKPILTYSVGYLLYEHEDYIILGFMMFDKGSTKHFQLIPKGMIKRRKELRK